MSDYIKREDAMKTLADEYDECEFKRYAEGLFKDIPSADVAPVRHARWKSGACSECGGIKPMTRIEDCGLLIWEAPYKLNYCPNCGAKMDGEDKNCDTCKYYDKWWYAIVCDGCTKEHYYWERRDDDKSCDTCKHYDKGWDDAICDGCTTADSRWERRDDETD